MTTLESGGAHYVSITQETYNKLCAAKEASEKARFVAVENFRTWCEANKGTTTVEEGLRACTIDELQHQFYAAGGYVAGCTADYIRWLVQRLKEREAQAQAEIAAAPVEVTMPEDDEEEGDNGSDND